MWSRSISERRAQVDATAKAPHQKALDPALFPDIIMTAPIEPNVRLLEPWPLTGHFARRPSSRECPAFETLGSRSIAYAVLRNPVSSSVLSCLVPSLGRAMRRRSRASGQPIKTRRRKAITLKRSNASKVARRRGSAAAAIEDREQRQGVVEAFAQCLSLVNQEEGPLRSGLGFRCGVSFFSVSAASPKERRMLAMLAGPHKDWFDWKSTRRSKQTRQGGAKPSPASSARERQTARSPPAAG